jgi:hypothetical protein
MTCWLRHSHSFILNGLVNANQILGEEAFNLQDWRVIGEYVYDDEGGRHQAFYSPVRDVVVLGEKIKANERIQVEQSLKYSQSAATKLWGLAGMTTAERWALGQEYGEFTNTSELYHCPTPSLRPLLGRLLCGTQKAAVSQRMTFPHVYATIPLPIGNLLSACNPRPMRVSADAPAAAGLGGLARLGRASLGFETLLI